LTPVNKVAEQGKPEILRQVARDLVKEARAALESAARNGQQPPTWVQELMTPTGWAHYRELLGQVAEPFTAHDARAKSSAEF
jgi:hypothetical protein